MVVASGALLSPLFGQAAQLNNASTEPAFAGSKFGAKKRSDLANPDADATASRSKPSPRKDDTKTLPPTFSCDGWLPYDLIICPISEACEVVYQLKSKEMKTFIPLLAADW